MRNPFALTKIFGIEIRADLSWMIAFGAFLWSLGSYYFPSTYPELITLDIWTLTIAVMTFLYVSIAAHEFGHSLLASMFNENRRLLNGYTIGRGRTGYLRKSL